MSEIADARRRLGQVRTMMRKGQLIPSIQAFQDALRAMLANPLMKAERDEFEKMFADTVHVFNSDKEFIKMYAMKLDYKPGAERVLYDIIVQIAATVKEEVVSEAQIKLVEFEEKKEAELAEAKRLLEAENFDNAFVIFAQLGSDFPDDGELFGTMGEACLRVGEYDKSIEYLTRAIELEPGTTQYYNAIAIALRKRRRFAEAEKYYFLASQQAGPDANLLFNLARLYIEWEHFEKAIKAVETALKLQPNFLEATKLREYAIRKMNEHIEEP